jgi:hypothetical protein
VRLLLIIAAALLTGCASAPAPVAASKADSAEEAWYGQAVEQLTTLHRDAESLFKRGQSDEAAAKITQAQPLMNRVLAVRQPTVAAMEAASDLDDLYGRMLLSNRHYGSARLLFQKNRARWRNWQPQTEETARRLKQADAAIAECDRHMAE